MGEALRSVGAAQPVDLELAGLPEDFKGEEVSAMLLAVDCEYAATQKHKTAILNLGTPEFVSVACSARIICQELGVDPEFRYAGGVRGWAGDSPFIFLDTRRMRAIGGAPSLNISQALSKTVGWLRENEWVFEKRDGKPLQRPVAKAS